MSLSAENQKPESGFWKLIPGGEGFLVFLKIGNDTQSSSVCSRLNVLLYYYHTLVLVVDEALGRIEVYDIIVVFRLAPSP